MTAEDEGDERVVASKRKAWTYEPAKASPLADFAAGGNRRKAFLRYWIFENIDNAVDLFLYFSFMLLPASVCSDLGGWLGRLLAPRFHKAACSTRRQGLLPVRWCWRV